MVFIGEQAQQEKKVFSGDAGAVMKWFEVRKEVYKEEEIWESPVQCRGVLTGCFEW